MTEAAFVSRLLLGSRGFWLVMVEIEVSPVVRRRKALRILHAHISTVVGAGEIPSSRRLCLRTIGMFRGTQSELQLLKHDCSVGELIRFLILLVCQRLDVNVVILRETGLAPLSPLGVSGDPT